MIIERLDARMVACKIERLFARVPYSERELTAQPHERLCAPLLKCRENDLRIPFRFVRIRKLALKFPEIENLAVEGNDEPTGSTHHRLIRAQVKGEDGEPVVAEGRILIRPHSRRVGSAMLCRFIHQRNEPPVVLSLHTIPSCANKPVDRTHIGSSESSAITRLCLCPVNETLQSVAKSDAMRIADIRPRLSKIGTAPLRLAGGIRIRIRYRLK